MGIDTEKALKTIDEIPSSRLSGMQIAANIHALNGAQDGQVVSGGWVGLWEKVDGKPQISLVMRKGETIEDYFLKPTP